MSLIDPRTGQPATVTVKPPEGTVEVEVPEIIEADTAFIVFRDLTGRTIVSPDLNLPIVSSRIPTTHDVVGMCANAQDDTRAQATIPGIANTVVGMLMQAGQQQAQRQLSPEEQAAMQAAMQKQFGGG